MLWIMSDNRPVALVTGGAKRVGRAIALGLGRAGYDVAITYLHSAGEARSLVKELEGMGRRGIMIQADLTKPADATRQVRVAFEKTFHRLDVLVNNASVYEPSGLQETTIEQMDRFWAIHVQSPLLLAREFETMLRSARGHILNMIDLMAERPGPEFLSYAASKAGLASLTKGLARTLAPEVTVNGIAPGVVEWPVDYPQSEREKYLKRVPLARAGTPEDVAEAVLFLTRPGGYITGQIVRLDGGRSVT
jgi:pteridine reductase